MSDPYRSANPGDPILAETWNEMQRDVRDHVLGHTHTGAENAGAKLTGDSIDSRSTIDVEKINAKSTLTVKGIDVGPKLDALSKDKLSVTGGEISGSLVVKKDLATEGKLTVGQRIDMPANGALAFADNGEIFSKDPSHRILFRRSEDILELREYGKIVLSAGVRGGNSTETVTVTSKGMTVKGTVASNAMVHRRVLFGFAGSKPFFIDYVEKKCVYVRALFGYAMPDVAAGAKRKYRLYAVYTDNMPGGQHHKVIFKFDNNKKTRLELEFPSTWDAKLDWYRDAFSNKWFDLTGDLKGLDDMSADIYLQTSMSITPRGIPAAGRLYYLELQAWDFYD